MTSDEVLKYLEELGAENACLLEPRSDYDSCLVGVGYRFNDGPLAVYDLSKVMSVLEADMTQEEAQEYFEFNTLGAWMGDGTPMFVELDSQVLEQ